MSPGPRVRMLRPGWPLVGLLALYPLWWALGLGVLIFPLLALPMAVALARRHLAGGRLRLPPGFGWWLVFLAAVVLSLSTLGVDPPGTVNAEGSGRLVAVAYRLVEYLALTVMLLYAGNLDPVDLPRRRQVRLLAWLFAVTVAGGMLGVLAGRFAFSSPVELLLPTHLRQDGFVQSLVHPSAAQVQDVIGEENARPSAPWGYTNTWGNNYCLLVGWFVVACWPLAQRRRTKVLAAAGLALSVVPVVYSLNRGLWLGLAVLGGYLALRFVHIGRRWFAGLVTAAALALVIGLAVTPLGTVVTSRLADAKSAAVRVYLTEQALAGVAHSPIIGFGTTRATQGGRNSIAVGETATCQRCGNFTIGGNGQLWQLLFAHGIAGTAGYLGFFGYGLWRFRQDRTPTGIAGSAAIVGGLVAMLWYNALVTPLALLLLGYSLLWRAETERALSQ